METKFASNITTLGRLKAHFNTNVVQTSKKLTKHNKPLEPPILMSQPYFWNIFYIEISLLQKMKNNNSTRVFKKVKLFFQPLLKLKN